MAQEWHYAKNGERHGPITAKQLKKLAESGELQPSDLVWTEGKDEWNPASTVKGLFPEKSSGKAPPPPPPGKTPPPGENPSSNGRTFGNKVRDMLSLDLQRSPSVNKWFRIVGGIGCALLLCGRLITALSGDRAENEAQQSNSTQDSVAETHQEQTASDVIQIVQSGEFAQHPGLPVGEVVDNFLENEKWSSTADEDGNHFVIVAGEMSYDGDPAIVLLTFQLDGESFTLHSVDLDGQPQGDAFADQLLEVMYREFE